MAVFYGQVPATVVGPLRLFAEWKFVGVELRIVGVIACGAALLLTQFAAPARAADERALVPAVLQHARARYSEHDYAGAHEAYERALALLESSTGHSSEELVEPLMGLTDSLAQMQRLPAAIDALTRAVAIVRRSSGLYDPRQYTLLEQLADLHSRTGDLDAAAASLAYMEPVSEKTHGARSVQHARSLTQIAQWQCRIGKFAAARDNYRDSIEKLDSRAHAEPLVDALLGYARCSLEELSVEGVATAPESLDRYRGPLARSGRIDPASPAFNMRIAQFLRADGEQALVRAAGLVEATDSLDANRRIEVLLQAGDWFQTKGHVHAARKYYARAQTWALRRTVGADDPLAAPVQVLYPVPALALRGRLLPDSLIIERSLEVEFTVRADGRIDGERVVVRDLGKSAADEVMQALRVARFRPRVVGGKAVATDNVRFRQVFRVLK